MPPPARKPLSRLAHHENGETICSILPALGSVPPIAIKPSNTALAAALDSDGTDDESYEMPPQSKDWNRGASLPAQVVHKKSSLTNKGLLAGKDSDKSFKANVTLPSSMAAKRERFTSTQTDTLEAGECSDPINEPWEIVLPSGFLATDAKRVVAAVAELLDIEAAQVEEMLEQCKTSEVWLETRNSRKEAMLRAQEYRDKSVGVRIHTVKTSTSEMSDLVTGIRARIQRRRTANKTNVVETRGTETAPHSLQSQTPPKTLPSLAVPAQDAGWRRSVSDSVVEVANVADARIVSPNSMLVPTAPPGHSTGRSRTLVPGNEGGVASCSPAPQSPVRQPQGSPNWRRRHNAGRFCSEIGPVTDEKEAPSMERRPMTTEDLHDNMEASVEAHKLKLLLQKHKDDIKRLSRRHQTDVSKLTGTLLAASCNLVRTFMYGRGGFKPSAVKETMGSKAMINQFYESWELMDPNNTKRVTKPMYQAYCEKLREKEEPLFSSECFDCLEKMLFEKRSYFCVDDLLVLAFPAAGVSDLQTMRDWFEEAESRRRIEPPPLLKKEDLDGLRSVFELADLDKSGSVSFEELVHAGILYDYQKEDYTRQWGKAEMDYLRFSEFMCPNGFRAHKHVRTSRLLDGRHLRLDEATGCWHLQESWDQAQETAEIAEGERRSFGRNTASEVQDDVLRGESEHGHSSNVRAVG